MLLGKTLVLTTEKTTYELEEYLETLQGEGLTINEARQAALEGRFAPIVIGSPIVPFQDYWIKVDLDNQYSYTDGHIEWMLYFSTTWASQITTE